MQSSGFNLLLVVAVAVPPPHPESERREFGFFPDSQTPENGKSDIENLKFETKLMSNIHVPVTSEVTERSNEVPPYFTDDSSLGFHKKAFPAMWECSSFDFVRQLYELLRRFQTL